MRGVREFCKQMLSDEENTLCFITLLLSVVMFIGLWHSYPEVMQRSVEVSIWQLYLLCYALFLPELLASLVEYVRELESAKRR